MAEFLCREDEHGSIRLEIPVVQVVRCRDCRWAHEAPLVDGWQLECWVRPLSRHYTPDMGFCHLGEGMEDA